jgi:acyl-[acyl-carrier-protein]-phospholipid O-acyltransferase/long-chain-fatty-acid--[acyl-carrier-protein] ligase
LTGGMLLPLLSGVKVFFYPSPLHYRIIPEMSYDTNSTILFGTETFLSAYAKYAHQYDFYSVRYVFAGAEKLREQTRLIWSQKFGVRIFEGYGTTETSPVLATNTPMENKVGTVGRFLPGIDYQLKPVPGIEDGGLLLVSGPNVMQGYLLADNPGVLQPPVDGWYDTGDIVAVDEFGYVTIKGRVKRFAKIGGEMVSLTMVEQQLNLLWPEFLHAVVSVPDEKKGEQIILVTTNVDAARDAMVQYAKTVKMPEIAIPKKIRVVKALPLLGTGKIDYVSVKNMCLEET